MSQVNIKGARVCAGGGGDPLVQIFGPLVQYDLFRKWTCGLQVTSKRTKHVYAV